MPVVPLKGEHQENWQALLASVAEKTPDVRVWSGGAAMWFSLPRLLRLWLVVFVAMCSVYLVNLMVNPRWSTVRTWGYCWDRKLWDWYDSELKKSGATKREPDNRGYSPARRLYPIPIGTVDRT